MTFSLLFMAVMAFNGVLSDTNITQISCSGGYFIGSRCLIQEVNTSDLSQLEIRLSNGTGCHDGTYSVQVIDNKLYLTVARGCSGVFDIVKIDPPTYDGRCGVNVAQSGFRIIGGKIAAACHYPWMVWVKTKRHACGGFIIDKDHIVTISTCLRSKQGEPLETTDNILVRSGSTHKGLGVERTAQRIFNHPDYDKFYFSNNIGILRLNESIKFDGCQSPVCIGSDPYFAYNETNCRVMGWGTTSDSSYVGSKWLRWSEETILSEEECKAEVPFPYPEGSIVCGKADETAFCTGDGGSPLVCLAEDRWYAYGIISATKGSRCSENIGIYTSLPYYYDWIQKSIDSP